MQPPENDGIVQPAEINENVSPADNDENVPPDENDENVLPAENGRRDRARRNFGQSNLSKQSDCCICYEEASIAAFNECGHMCVGLNCYNTRLADIVKELCPICRRKSNKLIKIYPS